MQQVARSSPAEASGPDNVTLDIIRGKLLAAADEMGVVLARASMAPVIYEVLDFACGITDADAQLLSQTNGITVFTGTFQERIVATQRKFVETIAPGDVFVFNDPFDGGSHLPDVSVIKPIFSEGALLGFAIAVAHWTELGGTVPGSLPPDATEIFHEGLRLPPVRIHKAGVPVAEIIDLIMANLRLPVIARGDLNAQLASVNIAERRLHELCAKYGRDTVRMSFAHILDSGERVSRAGIAALPDGVYGAEDFIDGDGFADEPIPIRVRVRIKGDEITFDFTGSSAQRKGPLNAPRSALLSAVKTVFRALVDPQAPSNEGWFRPLHVVVPDGTVFSAQYPSPVGWYYEITGHASELAWKALAQVAPERFSAGSYLSLCPTFITGMEPDTGEPFALIEPHHGGWGATESNDGESALIAVSDGDTYNYSVELLEAKYPIRCHRYGLNTEDGSGAGRYRGGYGIRKEYEILADEAMFYGGMARTKTRPWGVDGGAPGSVNHLELQTGGRRWRGERVPSTPITRGDRVTIVTGGGGGHGDPRTRPAQTVAEDVLAGYITVDEARQDYGVVVGPDGGLDVPATSALRAGE